jgi:uncharacterized protein (DUF362 family)/ferredoxin
LATSSVSIIKCDSYHQAEVEAAVHQSLELLGGIARFVKPGQRVLIKPNILQAASPEAHITTHPAVVSAVVKEVLKAGGRALVGDSPSNAHAFVPQTYERTGIKKATEEAGGEMVYFQQEGVAEVKSPSNSQRIKMHWIAKVVLEVDVIINLPKIKTHNLTLFTGAIKNMFGVVPGFYKSQFHINALRPRDLAELLVDVIQIARPKLNIFDAVLGMEGNGPAGGEPRKLGAIIASADYVAADAVGSCLIGFKPLAIDTTAAAFRRKLGEARLERIQVLGERIEDMRQKDWKHSINKMILSNLVPEPLFNFIKPLANQLRINPEINQEKCTQCLVCVKNCPAKTIAYLPNLKIVKIDLKNCINCFCCHEMCEYQAVELKPSWLTRLLRIA